MKFSNKEIKDLVFAGAIISAAFAVLLSGGLRGILSSGRAFFIIFIVAFFTAGIGFLLHELMHKYIAQGYGLKAEFRAFYPFLGLAFIFSFFGFIFAAPGAVFINGALNREKNGKISLAGPATNILLALFFLILIFLLPTISFFNPFFQYGLRINALLAAFNMIPIMPFDGAKVLAWNKAAYSLALLISIGLYFVSMMV